MERAVHHALRSTKPGESLSTTYLFRGSAGNSLYITVGVDEYGVVNSMFINLGASGSTIHNVCNALARVISIAIQNDKATVLQIVQTMEDVSSEVVWIHDDLGRAGSIPSAIALVLLRQLKLEEELEKLHTAEEEE